ncbi:MAG: glycoside hydrolase family 20 zincin-like fold domain-containing protein [Victivallaceae bacterium]
MKKLLMLTVLSAMLPLAAADRGMTVEATPSGFLIHGEGADLSTMTSVIVCVPPFRDKHFYNITDELEFVNTPERAEIIQKGPTDKVKIADYSVTRSGDSLVLRLEAKLNTPDPTDLENTVLVIPEYLLAGSTFHAVLADGTRQAGFIPLNYEGEPEVRHVFEKAVKATFDTRFGTFSFETLKGPASTLGDRRAVLFEERRCFWLGHLAAMNQKEPYVSEIKLTFTPPADRKISEPLVSSGKVKVSEENSVVWDYKPPRPLLPAPKAVEFYSGKYFDTSKGYKLSSNVNDAWLDRALRGLSANGQGGLNSDSDKIIRVEIGSGEGKLIPPENPEGYLLSVEENEIKLFARTPRGAFYGIQTLHGLFEPGKGFRCALVRDWPDFQMRAVHFMLPDRDALPLLSRIITEVMVPMKMNTLIIECEFVHWECIPNLHVPWGMPKADCEALVKLCEENYIDPIPLLQTLSHTPWLFSNKQNLDMCEDTRNPYCYFTSHPGLYPLMTKVLDEVMETFHHPKYIHIGHDELYTWAEYPCRPESKAIGTPKLVYDDVMWYYNYAKKRNAKIMMWHDIFVTREESPENGHGGGHPDWADTIRPALPRDIVFCVWRYESGTTRFVDLENLAAEGFEVAGSSWFANNNVERLTRHTKTVGGLGMISTTWIYPIVDKKDGSKIESGCFDALEKWFIQLAPYVRSGCWSWNCSDDLNKFDGKAVFDDLLEPTRFGAAIGAGLPLTEGAPGNSGGRLVNISSAANVAITKKFNPFLDGSLYGFDSLKPGVMRAGRVDFDLPERDGALAAVALKSRLNPGCPGAVELELGGVKAAALYFLHTAIGVQPKPKEPVAEYVLTYADGASAVLPVRYQREVSPPEEDVNYLLSTGNRLNWKDGKQDMSMWFAAYANPFPDKAIAKITVRAVGKNYPFYLFGVTLGDHVIK